MALSDYERWLIRNGNSKLEAELQRSRADMRKISIDERRLAIEQQKLRRDQGFIGTLGTLSGLIVGLAALLVTGLYYLEYTRNERDKKQDSFALGKEANSIAKDNFSNQFAQRRVNVGTLIGSLFDKLMSQDCSQRRAAESIILMADPGAVNVLQDFRNAAVPCANTLALPKIEYKWERVRIDDCSGLDFEKSIGPKVDDSKCNANSVGITAVCWLGGAGACTYKAINAENCKGGSNPGILYSCNPTKSVK